jgi:hypothetical protein
LARLVTLAQLRTAAYRLCDVENAANRFPTSEVNTYINNGIAEFADVVIKNRGSSQFFENQTTIIMDGYHSVYPLPQDFFSLLHVQVNLSRSGGTTGDTNIQIREFTWAERAELSSSTPGWAGQPFAFMIHGGQAALALTTQGTIQTQYAIEFLPQPAAGLQIQVFYIPSMALLVNDYDTFDGINGWDEYPAIYAAIKMRRKDDLDTSDLKSDLADIKSRIEGMAAKRQRVGSARIQDIRKAWPQYAWRRRTTT